jgi:Tfp pilus assembly protein PilF
MFTRHRWIISIVLCIAAGLAACSRSPQAKEARFLKRGAALLERKDYARARIEFQNAVKVMPKDADAYYQLGMAYLGSNNLKAAASAFYRATSLNPQHADAQTQFSRLIVGSSDHRVLEEAEKRARQVILVSPDSAMAIETLAIAEFKLGKPDEAVALIEAELAKAPADVQKAQVLAQMKIARKDLAGAEKTLKNSATSASQSPPAAVALAQFYRVTGKLTEAEAEAQRALGLDRKYGAALFTLALIQTQAKRLNDAEQTYRELSFLPDNGYQSLYGRFLFAQGKRDAALAEFTRLHASDPGDRRIRSLLVKVYLEMNRPAEAQKILADALKKNSKDVDALVEDGQLRVRSGDLAGAEKELRVALNFQPNLAPAHFLLALVQGQKGFSRGRRQELNEALRLEPAYLAARLSLADDYLRARDAKAAIQLLDQAPQQQKNDARVVMQRNWALLSMGDSAGARKSITGALAAAKTPELTLQRGVVNLLDRDYRGALADAEEVLKSNPASIRAIVLLVDAYAGQKRWPKAIEEVRAFAARSPQNAELQVYFAQLLMTIGNRAEAGKVLDAAITATPNAAAVRVATAQLDIAEHRSQEARQQLQAALAVDPQNLAALALLAYVEQTSGNTSAAIARYQEMLRMDSGNPFVMNNLAYLLAPENPDEALKLAQNAVELAPDVADIQDTVGWVLYRKGIYSAALLHLKKAVEQEPTPPRQFHLGVCYLKTGDIVHGKQILNAALKKDPNLPKTEQGW